MLGTPDAASHLSEDGCQRYVLANRSKAGSYASAARSVNPCYANSQYPEGDSREYVWERYSLRNASCFRSYLGIEFKSKAREKLLLQS